MTTLLDISPLTEEVPLHGGQSVTVTGVSGTGIADLFLRFPELRMMVTGKEVEITKIIALGPDIVAAVIAAGTGLPGDQKAEEVAATLSIEAQVDILAAILRVSLPNGVDPFVAKLEALGLLAEKSGKALATRSRKPSKVSSQQGTHQQSPGATPPDK